LNYSSDIYEYLGKHFQNEMNNLPKNLNSTFHGSSIEEEWEFEPVYQAVSKRMVKLERVKNVLEIDYGTKLQKLHQKYDFNKLIDFRKLFKNKAGFKRRNRNKYRNYTNNNWTKLDQLRNTGKTPVSFYQFSTNRKEDYTPKNLKCSLRRRKYKKRNWSYLDMCPKTDLK